MLFATPMILLFYIGIFASYLLVLKREGRRMPAKILGIVTLVILLLLSVAAYFATLKYHLHYLAHWPFISQ